MGSKFHFCQRETYFFPIHWSPLDFIFCQIVRIVFQVQYVCRRERVTQFKIKFPVFMERNVHIYMTFCVSLHEGKNCKIFLGLHCPKDLSFQKYQKQTKKMQVSKATSGIRRLLAWLDIHYNNTLNTEVQKQNETEIKKLQTKVVDLMIYGIHCYTFFLIDIKFS